MGLSSAAVFRSLLAITTLAFVQSVRAISNGQIDDFENGTTQSWANGGAGAPAVVNVSTGGPAGANDNFIRVTADGSGAGMFLTVFNRNQWLGNYIGAGITAIEVDLKNFGSTELNMCIGFKDAQGPGGQGYVTSTPFTLAVGSGWQHATFLIDAADLVSIGSPADFNTFFTNGPVEVRFINEADPSNLNGDAVVGQVGIDNIHAVPEPSCLLLLALGGLAPLVRRRTTH